MNPPQGEVVQKVADTQPNEQAKKLAKLFYQTSKTLYIFGYNDETNERIKLVLNIFAAYERTHDKAKCYIGDANNVTAA